MKNKITLAALALCLCATANANVLVNGDFESGLTGWSLTGVAGIAGTPYFGGGSFAANGALMAVFNQGEQQASGVLSQSFATVAGHTYHVNFDYGTNNGNWQQINAVVAAQDHSVLSSGYYAAPGPALQAFGFDFVATSGMSTLTFNDVPGNWTYSTDGLLDNVVVAEASKVPEPASLALLMVGLAGLGALRRRAR